MNDIKKKYKNELFALVTPIIIFILVDVFFVVCNKAEIEVVFETKLLSIVILSSIFLILIAITKKTSTATCIIATILYTLAVINQIKVEYMYEPVYFSDVLYLFNLGEVIGIIDGTFVNSLKSFILPSICYLLITIICCGISLKSTLIINNSKTRLFMMCAGIVVLSILFIPNVWTTKFIQKNVFNMEERVDYCANTTNVSYYSTYGLISGMYGQMLENRFYEPEEYDEITINKTLSDVKTNEDNSFGTPNIIVFFAESFWNVDQLEEVQFDTKIAKNFEELKKEGIFFDMISPSYGGVSANVEFEFLTGANTMYFNKGYIPYMQLYKNDEYYDKPTIVKELQNNGYNTKIVAHTSDELFNCGKFYDYIGVNEKEFIYKVDESDIKGYYVSDESVVDKIIETFENKPKDKKQFYMALTMQAHMPYLKDKYNYYDINIVKSDLNQDMNETLLSYAQGIYDTDKQLRRLYEYIQKLEEPTMIVFYGDHLPYLKTTNNKNVLEYLEFFNTDNELLNQYRKYNTQALILANYELKEENINFVSPDLLGCYLINKMDISISDYYKWLYTTINSLPSSNHVVSQDANGNLYYTNNLNSELEKIYNLRKCIQYKFFVK